ncbi:MAG: hypothetical protein CVU46_12985 [Chloroflexi bacterium HGW-Chloroflexi-8]|jgi:hypothetical protein|nr:MAG: hypothetical protein CVU46_12985 [Chloroflexi bacterium HGW-Chloroflexi-8]
MMEENFNLNKFSKQFIDDHNQEAKEVWDSFHQGKPIRPPMAIGTNTQFFIFNNSLNPGGKTSFHDYLMNARTMLDFNLKSMVWRIENIAQFCDDQIELPDQFEIKIDFQNFEEASYFGAPIEFLENQVPDTRPILAGDRKNALFDLPYPDPMSAGFYHTASLHYEAILTYLQNNPTFLDRPVILQPYGFWTGGFLTLAIALRGFEFLTDLIEDEAYAYSLLNYLFHGILAKVEAYHKLFNLPFPGPELFFTDDAIQLISSKMLRKFLLPLYQTYKSKITTADHIKMHLCGDASRHFKLLRDELGVYDFETGFPINFTNLRKDLGPDVTIHGGPNIMILRDGSAQDVQLETRRILRSGILDGGKFVLREGNNLAPHTPFENLAAMYQEVKNKEYNY